MASDSQCGARTLASPRTATISDSDRDSSEDGPHAGGSATCILIHSRTHRFVRSVAAAAAAAAVVTACLTVAGRSHLRGRCRTHRRHHSRAGHVGRIRNTQSDDAEDAVSAVRCQHIAGRRSDPAGHCQVSVRAAGPAAAARLPATHVDIRRHQSTIRAAINGSNIAQGL